MQKSLISPLASLLCRRNSFFPIKRLLSSPPSSSSSSSSSSGADRFSEAFQPDPLTQQTSVIQPQQQQYQQRNDPNITDPNLIFDLVWHTLVKKYGEVNLTFPKGKPALAFFYAAF